MAVATADKLFKVALVTPEAQLIDGEIAFAEIPGVDGMVGLLTHRAPLLTQLGIGILTLTMADGTVKRFLISGGYAQMKDNQLTILTDEAIPAADVTPARRAAQAAELAQIQGVELAQLNRRQAAQARLTAMDRLLGNSQ